MPTYFQRPENALKRANEFIDVGKKQRALDALYDVIKSKKHRTWQKIHEPIMEKYLELCVELRKSHIAKEGLYQYKNICQQVNIKSLEDVVRRYIQMAEEKTEGARQESHQVVLDVDDLDMPDTPESLLLKAVSGEDTQDRTDRAILTPWVKFLWESYRQCLDLLRNNSKVEKLYQDIAQQAFKFCLKYTRKTEFRKLCDNLRTHLGHVHKHQHQQTAINLNNPESQAMHLETRLVQLDSAINMELWQEAFKAVEDIHGLITLSKKAPRPSLMANYYMKLGLVFWKSGNSLFHACTLHRLFHLAKEQRKNITQEELQKMASRVLCATLAVPIPASRNVIDTLLEMGEGTLEKQRRLANLLMLQNPPKRQALVKDLAKYSVVQHVHPELQNLYQWLESEFHPLRLYGRVKSSIEFISENDELAQYVPNLEDIIVTRVLKQVSQVYQTIQFSRFADLVPFASNFRLERIIVNAARNLELQVRIDHKDSSLSFGTDLGVSQKEDVPEGPYIQKMPSETIRSQLVHMAQALHRAVRELIPKDSEAQREELKSQIINNYKLTAKKEHTRILQRRQTIEDRKEQLEHLNDQREREEYEQQEEVRRKALEAEMARLDREAKERERQRRVEESREIAKKHALERIEQLKKSELGARVVQNIDEEDLAKMDVDDIMARQVEQLEKEKKELHERLRSQEKKVDHMARAKRSKEIPLLEKQFEEEHIKAREFWEGEETGRIEKLKSERSIELETRDRLRRMKEDRNDFLNQLKDRRKKNYKDKLLEFEKKLTEERKKRMTERKTQRKEERRRKWTVEREEAKQRAIDEALVREREEKERVERESREAEEREYAEKLAKLEEQARKQKEREAEIEARRVEDSKRSVDRPSRDRPAEDRWARGGGGGPEPGPGEEKQAWRPSGQGGWREREKEKHDSWKKDPEKENEEQRGGMPDDRERPADDKPPTRDAWKDRENDRDAGERVREREERGPPPRDEGVWRDRGAPRDEEKPAREAWRDREGGRDRRFDNRDIRLDKDEMNRMAEEREKSERLNREEGGSSAWRSNRGGEEGGGAWRSRGSDGPRDGGRSDAWRGGDRGGDRFGDRGGDRGGDRFGDRGGDRFGDRGGGRFGDRGGDRFGDRGGDRFGDRGGDRFGDRGGDRFGDRGSDRFGDRGGDRFGDRGSDRFGDRGGDRFGDRGGDRGERDGWRSRGGEDRERRPPPRDDFRRGDRDERRGDDIRRGDRGGDEFRRGDRGGDRDDFRRGDRDEGKSRPAPERESAWRRGGGSGGGGPSRDRPRPREEETKKPAGGGGAEDDGWTTVKRA